MAKNLSLKNISIAYGGGTIATLAAGAVVANFSYRLGFQHSMLSDTGLMITGAWLVFVGGPSLIWTQDALRQALGIKAPPKISKGGGSYAGRRVPINWGAGRQSHVLLSSIAAPWLKQSMPEPAPEAELPTLFTVIYDDNEFTFTAIELRDFISKCHARDRAGRSGLSSRYWLTTHRPRMHRARYDALIQLLLQYNLIADRGERRSGRLTMPPQSAMRVIQAGS